MSEQAILVVEDNPDHLELTVLTLREQGVTNEIVVARDGAEALEYLHGEGKYAGRDTRKQPVLVLLDLKLPKLSGLDVLQRIRANPVTVATPVIMLTSSSEEADIVAAYKGGANSFVRKPVDFAEFTEKLRSLQVYWLLVNQPPPAG